MIPGRISKLQRRFVRFNIPHQFASPGEPFFVGLSRVHQGCICETIGAWVRQPEFSPTSAIGIEHNLCSLESSQEAGNDITFLSNLPGAVWTKGSDPHWRMGLLIRTGPDIHLTMVKVFSLPVKRPVVAGPRFQNEVVGFPETRHHVRWSMITSGEFVRYAAHEAA